MQKSLELDLDGKLRSLWRVIETILFEPENFVYSVLWDFWLLFGSEGASHTNLHPVGVKAQGRISSLLQVGSIYG